MEYSRNMRNMRNKGDFKRTFVARVPENSAESDIRSAIFLQHATANTMHLFKKLHAEIMCNRGFVWPARYRYFKTTCFLKDRQSFILEMSYTKFAPTPPINGLFLKQSPLNLEDKRIFGSNLSLMPNLNHLFCSLNFRLQLLKAHEICYGQPFVTNVEWS